MPDSPLDRLSAEGQSVWLDSISRHALKSRRARAAWCARTVSSA